MQQGWPPAIVWPSSENKISSNEKETLAMKKQTLIVQEIIRTWKDKQFRDNLSEEQRAQLSVNPAGLVETDDEQLVQFMSPTGILGVRLPFRKQQQEI
jgi:mersacidin/lichenicidin family type 2 lantibiotic